METTLLRDKLLDFIANADEKELQRFSDFIIQTSQEEVYEVSEAHKTILDQRLKSHTKTPTAGKDWNDLAAELSANYNVQHSS